MENKLAIEKLTGGNYEAWKFNVEMLLAREQLWKYVENDPPNPNTDAWKEGDHRTRGTIALLVGASQRRLIQKCTTAKETWKKLKDTFEKRSAATVMSMLRRVMTLKFVEGEDVGQHLNEYEDLFERLANAGYELPEKIQILMVLYSMPESYDNLGQVLMNVAEEDLTLELIKVKLTDEALKRQENSHGESLLKAKIVRKQIVCHHCRKPGHKKRDCRLLEEEEAESADELQYKSSAREGEDEGTTFALSAEMSRKSMKTWIIDSGASTHMCGEKKFFDEMRPISKRTVTLADGRRTSAEAIGSGELICKDKDGHEKKLNLSGVLYIPELETNLMSVGRLTQKGANVSFSGTRCYISKQGRQAAVAIKRDGLYFLQQPAHETAGIVRGVDTREPEVVSLEFGLPRDVTFCAQAGGEFSRVEEESKYISAKNAGKLQIKEQRKLKSVDADRINDSQQASRNGGVEDQGEEGWIKVEGKRRKSKGRVFHRGGVLE